VVKIQSLVERRNPEGRRGGRRAASGVHNPQPTPRAPRIVEWCEDQSGFNWTGRGLPAAKK